MISEDPAVTEARSRDEFEMGYFTEMREAMEAVVRLAELGDNHFGMATPDESSEADYERIINVRFYVNEALRALEARGRDTDGFAD